MDNVFLIYDKCCFYEIVSLNYFLNFTGEEMIFCSIDGKKVKCMEGFTVEVDKRLDTVDIEKMKSLIITGGDIKAICNEEVYKFIRKVREKKILIGGICAGVDILDNSGILKGIESTHSKDVDVVEAKNIVTARANAYIDFAINIAKRLQLFSSDEDLKETIDFWKYHKRVQ